MAAERPASALNRVAFGIFYWTVGPLTRFAFRMRIEDRPSLDGAYIVVANHTSFLDPLLLGAASRRRITFLMSVAVFRSPGLGWFYRFVRAIPLALRGGTNRQAMRAARAVLRRGEVLGVFPEGGISRDGGLMLGNPGAVSLVLAEGVPVVPVFMRGADRVLPPGARCPRLFRRVHVRFGAPIPHDALVDTADPAGRRQQHAVATRRIMDAIAELGETDSRERFLETRGRAVATRG